MWDIVGTLAILIIESSYLPQIVKLWRVKEAEEFHLFFPTMNATGRVLAIIYQWHTGGLVFAWGFAVGVLMRLFIVGQVIYYQWRLRLIRRRREEAVAI